MMTCKTCRQPNVEQLNGMLAQDLPLRDIALAGNDISLMSVSRHKNQCVPELMEQVKTQRRDGLLADVDEIKSEIDQVKSEFPTNTQARVNLIAKRIDVLDKEAKLTGAYIQDKQNPADKSELLNKTAQLLADRLGFSPEQALELATFADRELHGESDAIN